MTFYLRQVTLNDKFGPRLRQIAFQLNYPTETVENFYNILNGSDELLTALDNPTVTKAVKHNIIDKIFDKEVSSFVKCLCDNGRITSYAEVYQVYKELIDDKEEF